MSLNRMDIGTTMLLLATMNVNAREELERRALQERQSKSLQQSAEKHANIKDRKEMKRETRQNPHSNTEPKHAYARESRYTPRK